ncbi:PI-PLC X domain-containing protein 2-like [Lycorma delicatula]|uniref:PI-PLC X domain-containing protein 2-like n=1 Tax=Lycorma delicatula TaxID=130591 RepID=UPI003F514939
MCNRYLLLRNYLTSTTLPVLWLLVAMVLMLHVELLTCSSVSKRDNIQEVVYTYFRPRRQVYDKSCDAVHIDIIISPQVSDKFHDFLVLFWDAELILPGDKVELYDFDPTKKSGKPLYSASVFNSTGWITTNITEVQNSTLPNTFTKYCLGFWAVYVRGDSSALSASSCLSTEPRWMEETWYAISRLTLANLFIPGTHNSAAYKESFSPYMNTIIYKYTYNQEINVLNQLKWGARALDLRIGYYPTDLDEVWWCNHDFVKIRPLRQILQDVKTFLRNTQEIVILDFHNFPVGFSKDRTEKHMKLVSFIEEEMKDYLAPASLGWSVSLNVLKLTGRRAILAYNAKEFRTGYTWAPVQQKWGNVQNVAEFSTYFEDIFSSQVSAPWAAMVQLTPHAFDVLFDSLGGLRNMAVKVNPVVTSWFNGKWGRLCHIVDCDFIRGTGIVKAAIKWNLKRAGFHNRYFYCNTTYS